MTLLSDLRAIISGKARELQNRTGTPDTRVDSSGSITDYQFNGQQIDRSELRDVKHIRESGGVIAQLVHAKSLMQFGTGVEFESDVAGVGDYLRDEFNDIDNLVIDLGEDAIWYPYSAAEIVETQGGAFSHIEPIEPWTLLPITNEFGEIIAIEQQVKANGSRHTERFDPDEIAWFILNKSSARDKTGISEVLRAEEEVNQFRNNREAVNSAIEIAGFPHHIWKVGREGASVIDDNELRRVRNMVDDMEGDTQFVMGRDVDHEMIQPGEFDFAGIQEHDLRELALALGLPLELANVGSDGLGSGMPAELRLTLFERQARAAQRALADQFVQHIIRPVLGEYSPYDRDVNVEMRLGDPIADDDQSLDQIAPWLTTNEVRERLDKSPADDDEIGDSYRKPANIEAPEQEEPEDGGGIGGLFGEDGGERRQFQEVSEITTDDYPQAAVENARMALEAREETGNPNDCGTRVGWERANQLDNGEALSEETISRMAAFERHEDNKEQGEEGRADCGWLMWNAWGGDEGIAWAQDKMDEFAAARENMALADGSAGVMSDLRTDSLQEWELQLMALQRKTHTVDDNTRLLGFTEADLPTFVKARLKDAIRGGAIFNQFDTIPSDQRMQLREFLEEELVESGGWTIDGLANRIQDLDAGLDFEDAQTIARTETQAITTEAREIGYEEKGQADDQFYWSGSIGDGRTTDTCKYLIAGFQADLENPGAFQGLKRPQGTNPFEGGSPMAMSALKEHIQDVARADPAFDTTPRTWTPHVNCRKTFVRHVE